MRGDATLHQASLLTLLNRLIENGHQVRVVYVSGQWLDIDQATDIDQARDFL